VGLLWCVAILSVVVVGVLHRARMDLQVAKNYGDRIQAHYLALAGIERAKALIFEDARERKRSARNHTGDLYDAPTLFRDVPLGRGKFQVFRQGRRDEGGKIIYGVSDEESRLNLNHVAAEDLARIYRMTPEVIAALFDWRDRDNTVTTGGAETEYYSSLRPPSLPRNGPLQTTREMLMVAGVPRDLFLGEDANENELLDPEESDGNESYPPDNQDDVLDAGWSEFLTVDSQVGNENAAGQDRVNVQSADENSLALVPGISPDIAKAIVAYRGQNQIESLADLLDVAQLSPQNQSQTQPPSTPGQLTPGAAPATRTAPGPGRSRGQPTGPKLISEQLLMEIGDDVTTIAGRAQPGAININTASAEVLACLPGVDERLAQAIISYRKSAGFFPNITWLLKVDGMNQQIFKQVAPKVTARSETYRILSEGTVLSSGARKRIQVIVRLDAGSFDTLSYREDL
jgi:competence ComEA-like helix-hairpin-helix protein